MTVRAMHLEDAVVLQARERARQRLGYGAERDGELGLRHAEVDAQPLGGASPAGERALEQVAREA